MSEAREEAHRRWPEGWGSAIGDGTWRDGAINGFVLGAEWARAEWEAEQGEPEWEYRCTGPDGDTPRRLATESEVAWHMKSGCGEVQRRKSGPWLPVTNTGSEGK